MVRTSMQSQCKVIYYNFLQYQQNGSYLPFFALCAKLLKTEVTIFLVLIMVAFSKSLSSEKGLGVSEDNCS